MSVTNYPVKATKDLPESLEDGMTTIAISRTDGKKGKSGLCIVVPVVSESVLAVVGNNQIGKDWIASQIDTLRSKIASELNKSGKVITSDKIGIDALLVAMKSDTESQRMTKDSIGAWFDADLASLIAARIHEKMAGIAADKVEKLVAGYRAKFQELAGRSVSMPDAVRDQLTKALELLPQDYESVIGEKVTEKLLNVTEATETLAAL